MKKVVERNGWPIGKKRRQGSMQMKMKDTVSFKDKGNGEDP